MSKDANKADANKAGDDPAIVTLGTVAGRAPAPLVRKSDAENASSASPGAAADREQAKEREKPASRDAGTPGR